MIKQNTLKEIMDSTDETTRTLINKILKIEDRSTHIQKLTSQQDKDISEEILDIINQEIR